MFIIRVHKLLIRFFLRRGDRFLVDSWVESDFGHKKVSFF
jgi:hypothetical protein